MSYSQPARTAPRRTPVTVCRVRRRRALLGAVCALLLTATAFAAAGPLLHHKAGMASKVSMPATARISVSSVRWPARGQAALVVGNGQPKASPDEQPVAIASVTKVMTAYLTLERYPLTGAEDGFTITVTAADAQAEAQDAAQDQSVAAVAPGEQLTERQLLEALLIPSGNNIAQLLATQVSRSETRFIADMNAQARALGDGPHDLHGSQRIDPGTVSTAADQLRVFEQAMRFSVFRQIVSMASVTLPGAGTLTNFDPLIAEGYAGKTGSDSAAGGCLAFFTHVTLGGRRVTAVGVVLGQGQGNNTPELLADAGQAAEQLVESGAVRHRAVVNAITTAGRNHE